MESARTAWSWRRGMGKEGEERNHLLGGHVSRNSIHSLTVPSLYGDSRCTRTGIIFLPDSLSPLLSALEFKDMLYLPSVWVEGEKREFWGGKALNWKSVYFPLSSEWKMQSFEILGETLSSRDRDSFLLCKSHDYTHSAPSEKPETQNPLFSGRRLRRRQAHRFI